jgi:hypothetical protein
VATTAKGSPIWLVAMAWVVGGATRVARMCRGVQFPVSMAMKGVLLLGGLRREVAERV